MTELYRQVHITSMELKDITCNRCGKSCVPSIYVDEAGKVKDCESAALRASWGYASKKDGQTHRANLCEGCYDYVLEACGIKPDVKEW